MKHETVKSSNIKSIGWEDGVLEIEFNNGNKYSYADVTKEEYEKLKASTSIGKYFHSNIKGKFTATKL